MNPTTVLSWTWSRSFWYSRFEVIYTLIRTIKVLYIQRTGQLNTQASWWIDCKSNISQVERLISWPLVLINKKVQGQTDLYHIWSCSNEQNKQVIYYTTIISNLNKSSLSIQWIIKAMAFRLMNREKHKVAISVLTCILYVATWFIHLVHFCMTLYTYFDIKIVNHLRHSIRCTHNTLHHGAAL